MTRTNKGFLSLYIPLLAVLLIFTGCEDPGSVGGEFVDRPELSSDTLLISDTEILGYQSYSGRLSFIPIGHYSDQVFGDITSRGLFKPTRTPNFPDSVGQENFEDGFTLQLELQLDSLENYGDTLSQSSFTIYEVTSTWRGRTLRIDDDIQYGNQVGSFSINPGEKRVVIDNLSQDWIDEYKSYYNDNSIDIDSTYNFAFGGLIIIPDQGNSKITFPRSDNSRFLMINNAETDTVAVSIRDWGYTMDRTGAISPPNTFPLHTTMEGMLSITIPDSVLKTGTANRNIVRTEMLFYSAQELLDSNLPDNHARLKIPSINLSLVETVDPVYEYQFGGGDFLGFTSGSGSPIYRANITTYVNNVIFGTETRQELVLGVNSNSGVIRSALFYNETAPEQFRPKIIITSLVD